MTCGSTAPVRLENILADGGNSPQQLMPWRVCCKSDIKCETSELSHKLYKWFIAIHDLRYTIKWRLMTALCGNYDVTRSNWHYFRPQEHFYYQEIV